jgi:hypothetical protein
MNFLNPFVLIGLIATGLPLLLHLIARRRAREALFPSIRLLVLLRTDRIRMLRLKQLLVLLLRTLIVLCIVLGFAHPAIRSAFRSNARTAAVIVIDASAGMRFVDNGESLFERAKHIAGELLGLLGNGDTAAVIVAGSDVVVLDPGMTGDVRELTKRVAALEPAFTVESTGEAFERALELLGDATTINRELYYLTDGSTGSFPDSIGTASGDIRLYTILIGPSVHRGAVIDTLLLVDTMISPGRPVTFRAGGYAGAESGSVEVSFFVNGDRTQKVSVVPGSDGRFETDCQFTPETAGWLDVTASVEEGFFDAAEMRHLTVNVPGRTPVLILTGEEADGYFLARMLAPGTDDSLFSVTVRDAAHAVSADVTSSRVIVLAGVGELPDDVYRSILTAVMRGGSGLAVFPSENADAGLYRNGVFRDLFPLSDVRRIDLGSREGTRPAVMNQFDDSHPVIRGVMQGRDIVFPEVASFLGAVPPQGTRVFARYDNGSMAAGDMDCGDGRVVLFTAQTPSLTGELAFSGLFVPLFIRTVQYLSDTLPNTGHEVTGEPVRISFPMKDGISQVTVRSADRPAVLAEFDRIGTRVSLRNFIADEPGFYAIEAEGTERIRFSSDIPVSEAKFARAGKERIDAAFQGVKNRTIEADQDISGAVSRDRYGTELAGVFLGGALLLMAAEMALSRK